MLSALVTWVFTYIEERDKNIILRFRDGQWRTRVTRQDLVNSAATTWRRDVTEWRQELSTSSCISVLLSLAVTLTAAVAVATAVGEVTVGAMEVAVVVVAIGVASIRHLRDGCGVHHGGLTTPGLVTCCWLRCSTDFDEVRVLPQTQLFTLLKDIFRL